ncbi:hypothetical protein F2Q69_00051485 [Brassica cretica]|uniref:Uncharacterized protein n=1 Tax=Brassica cretica TaxID=69181 RepID=A0A8S9Q2H6_BRACR|nr:hypothetical protein F2Q69_00051485 [Brassica cretica]
MVSSLSFSCLGSEETQRKVSATHTKPCAVTSFPNMHFAPPQMVQTNFSFHYADPHYGGLLATPYLPHAPVIHAWHAHFLFSTDHRCRARPFQMFFEVLLLVFFFFQ